jgi:cytoskeletal protein CcmA (bactofilin family)
MFNRKAAPSLTYLSATSEIHGTLNVEGNLRIDGIVHGTIEVRGDLEISKTGLVEGPELKARNIVIQGVIKARVMAEGRLTLTRTARLEGDITAHAVDIEAGAHYVGHIATDEVKALPGGERYPELSGKDQPSLPHEPLA